MIYSENIQYRENEITNFELDYEVRLSLKKYSLSPH